MKSPAELGIVLLRQWSDGAHREERLANQGHAYPVTLSIGAPPNRSFRAEPASVATHLRAWKDVVVGEVEWEERSARALAEPVTVPVAWSISSAAEWLAAVMAHAPESEARAAMAAEHAMLTEVIAAVAPRFRRYIARQRALVVTTGAEEAITVGAVAAGLEPGQAAGLPLRAMPIVGADTKFFERNERLLTALLDLRFDNHASAVGLERFLGAAPSGGQWLLVVDLDGDLLPYPELRLSDQTIADRGLPGEHLLVVENEKCRHALPSIAGCTAVLGAGKNLNWLSSPSLAGHNVTYWGDLDTWGLDILASARRARPDLRPVLMDLATFESHQQLAVEEPTLATRPVIGLTAAEAEFFDLLTTLDRGRLEQERLPVPLVQQLLSDADRRGNLDE